MLGEVRLKSSAAAGMTDRSRIAGGYEPSPDSSAARATGPSALAPTLKNVSDPWIELVLNMQGGVTRQQFEKTFEWWETSVGEFEDEIGV